jgi:hypothetical protein
MAQSKVISAPHLKCYINGKLLGIVTGFRYSVRTGRRGARGIDQNTVQEWIPTTYDVSGQVEIVRQRGTGGLEGPGIVAFSDTILLEKYIKIDLLDRVTDKIVFSAINAVVMEQNWVVGLKNHMVGTFTFEAQDQENESRP